MPRKGRRGRPALPGERKVSGEMRGASRLYLRRRGAFIPTSQLRRGPPSREQRAGAAAGPAATAGSKISPKEKLKGKLGRRGRAGLEDVASSQPHPNCGGGWLKINFAAGGGG